MNMEYVKSEPQYDVVDTLFGGTTEMKQETLPVEPTPYPDCSRNRNAKFAHYWTRPAESPKGITSIVWKYFTRCATLKSDGTPYRNEKDVAVYVVKCHFCSKDLSYHSSSTKGMIFHLKRYHAIKMDSEARKALKLAEKEDLKRKLGSSEADKRQMVQLPANDSPQSSFERVVVKNIVTTALPFSYVEDESTRQLWRCLSSNVEMISRQRLTKLVSDAYCDFENARTQFLEAADYLAVTVDEWNEPSTSKPLLAIRAHGWTRDFQRFDVTLDIVDFLNKQYNPDVIAETIQEALLKNNLVLSNVLCIVGDGTPVTATAAQKLGIKWIQCLAHKIHLVMEELLETKEDAASTKQLVDLLSQFADVTKTVSTEGECVSAFTAAVVQLEIALEKMRADDDTNPTLDHLVDTALSLLKKRFFNQDSLLLNEDVKNALFLDPRFAYRLHFMSGEDWNMIKAEIESKAAVFDMPKELECINSNCSYPKSSADTEYDIDALSVSKEIFCAERSRTGHSFDICSAFQAQSETLYYIQQLSTFQGSTVQDVSNFWKRNSKEMPLLYQLARNYLSLPINALGLERIFSAMPSFMECKRRNSLGNFNPTQLVMLREYFLKGEKYFPHFN